MISEDRKNFKRQLLREIDGMTEQNTVIIGVLAENPYAEFMGDVNNWYC